MTINRIETLPAAASREAELAHLRKLAATCERGTYLASLFSEDLIAWIERKMADDVDVNIAGALAFEQAEARRTAGELAELKRQANTSGQVIDTLRGELRDTTARLELMTRLEGDKARQLRDALEAHGLDQAQLGEAICVQSERADAAEARAAKAELEVLKLKAQLYDLLTAGK